MGMPLKDISGMKFGKLLVVGRSENKGSQSQWRCICECGNVVLRVGGNLRRSKGRNSCGCLPTNKKHGMMGTPEYRSWQSMRRRCLSSSFKQFNDYGGRGVSICKEWETFEQFYKDMGNRPSGTSLDRINCNGNYEPSNCRWASRSVQQTNRRDSRTLSYNGNPINLTTLARERSISRATLFERLKRGLSAEQAVGWKKWSHK